MPKYVVSASGPWQYGPDPEKDVAVNGQTIELKADEAERIAGLHAQGLIGVSLRQEGAKEAVKPKKGTPTPALDNPPLATATTTTAQRPAAG